MNTSAIALDASCVAKLFLQATASPGYRRWHYRLMESKTAFRGPGVLQYEVGQIVHKELRLLPPDEKAKVIEHAMERRDASPTEAKALSEAFHEFAQSRKAPDAAQT